MQPNTLTTLQEGNTKVNFMLRILVKLYVRSGCRSESNGKLGSGSGYGSEQIIPNPQHCSLPYHPDQ
jgi:hypothetical protein